MDWRVKYLITFVKILLIAVHTPPLIGGGEDFNDCHQHFRLGRPPLNTKELHWLTDKHLALNRRIGNHRHAITCPSHRRLWLRDGNIGSSLLRATDFYSF